MDLPPCESVPDSKREVVQPVLPDRSWGGDLRQSLDAGDHPQPAPRLRDLQRDPRRRTGHLAHTAHTTAPRARACGRDRTPPSREGARLHLRADRGRPGAARRLLDTGHLGRALARGRPRTPRRRRRALGDVPADRRRPTVRASHGRPLRPQRRPATAVLDRRPETRSRSLRARSRLRRRSRRQDELRVACKLAHGQDLARPSAAHRDDPDRRAAFARPRVRELGRPQRVRPHQARATSRSRIASAVRQPDAVSSRRRQIVEHWWSRARATSGNRTHCIAANPAQMRRAATVAAHGNASSLDGKERLQRFESVRGFCKSAARRRFLALPFRETCSSSYESGLVTPGSST